MNICLFSPEEISKPLSLHDKRAEHLVKILHKKKGDCFEAGIIEGKAGTACITAISSADSIGDSFIDFTFTPESDGKELYPLVMIIGFPRPIQLRRLLRDVAGLGVCEIHLTGTELGEKSYMQSSLADQNTASRLLLDGTVQAASTHVPHLFLHSKIEECFESEYSDSVQNSIRIALDNVNPDCSLPHYLDLQVKKNSALQRQRILAAVGSERGWTDHERHILEQHGFVRCGMGTRILRTETAATAAASVILAATGAFDR